MLHRCISFYNIQYITIYILQNTCSSCDIRCSNSFNFVILEPIGEGEEEKEGEKGGEKEVVAEGEQERDLF
jgi:hypothetical protein